MHVCTLLDNDLHVKACTTLSPGERVHTSDDVTIIPANDSLYMSVIDPDRIMYMYEFRLLDPCEWIQGGPQLSYWFLNL